VTTNHVRTMIVIETEEAQIYESPVKEPGTDRGVMQYVAPVAGENEVVLVFKRLNAARVLRAWADKMERLER